MSAPKRDGLFVILMHRGGKCVPLFLTDWATRRCSARIADAQVFWSSTTASKAALDLDSPRYHPTVERLTVAREGGRN